MRLLLALLLLALPVGAVTLTTPRGDTCELTCPPSGAVGLRVHTPSGDLCNLFCSRTAPTQPTLPTTCSGLCYDTTATSGMHLINMPSTVSASVRIRLMDGKRAFNLSKHRQGYTSPAAIQYSVSERPGDFSRAEPCGGTFTTPSVGVAVTSVAGGMAVQCVVDPAKTYYLNIRYPDGACDGSCLVMVDFYR